MGKRTCAMRVLPACVAFVALTVFLLSPPQCQVEALEVEDLVGRRAGGGALTGTLSLSPGATSNTAGNDEALRAELGESMCNSKLVALEEENNKLKDEVREVKHKGHHVAKGLFLQDAQVHELGARGGEGIFSRRRDKSAVRKAKKATKAAVVKQAKKATKAAVAKNPKKATKAAVAKNQVKTKPGGLSVNVAYAERMFKFKVNDEPKVAFIQYKRQGKKEGFTFRGCMKELVGSEFTVIGGNAPSSKKLCNGGAT